MNRCLLILITTSIYSLISCSGGADVPSLELVSNQPAVADTPFNPGDMPSFPALRSGSDIPRRTAPGADSDSRSGNATPIDTNLLLNSSAGELSWAVYRLGSFAPEHTAQVTVSPTGGDMFWVAIADFTAGHWDFVAELDDSFEREIDSNDQISPDGDVFIAVMTWDGDAVVVEEVGLTMVNPHQSYMFGQDPQRTGRSRFVGPQNADVKWVFDRGRTYSAPVAVAADGTVYAAGNPNFYALNPDGTVKWTYEYGTYSYSGPAIAPDGTIYFGNENDEFVALNPDGSEKWIFDEFAEPNRSPRSSPVIDLDGNIYFGCDDDYVYALRPDGTVLWSYEAGGSVESSPAIGHNGSFYFGCGDNYLYSLDSAGEFDWKFDLVDSSSSAAPVIADDGTIFIGNRDGMFYAVNPGGTEKWSVDTGDRIDKSAAVAVDGTVYVGNDLGYLYAFDPDNGDELWSTRVDDWAIRLSPIIDVEGTIYTSDSSGNFFALNPDGSIKWVYYSRDDFEDCSPVIAANGAMYVGSANQGLYAFGPGNSQPVASLEVTYTGNNPREVLLDASGSSDAEGIVRYEWSFEQDSSADAITNEPTVTYTYSGQGKFHPTVKVYDTNDVYAKATVPASVPTNWWMLGGNAQHTGLAAVNGPSTNNEDWYFDGVGGDVRSSPVVDSDGTIYFGCDDGKLYALNSNGTKKWDFPTGHISVRGNSPAIRSDGQVIFGNLNNLVYAINSDDGTENWSITLEDDVTTSPVIRGGGGIWVGCKDGTLNRFGGPGSFDAISKSSLPINSSPALIDYSSLMVGTQEGELHSYGFADFTATSAIKSPVSVAPDGTIYFGSDDGTVYAVRYMYSLGTELADTYDAGSAVVSYPAIGPDGSVYIATAAGKLIRLSPTLDFIAEFDSGKPGRTSPVIGANGTVYCAFGEFMYAFTDNTVKLWEFDSYGDIWSTPAIGPNGRLYFGSDDNVLYCIGP